MSSAFNLSVADGIATLIFDLPGEKVNKLSPSALEDLDQKITEAANRQDIKALVIRSGKQDSFIAGADISTFQDLFKDESKLEAMIRKGHSVFNKIEALPYPTIAAIHGTCLGGGMELALACKYRIVSDHPKTMLGLPEVSLGIIPGWGGTQRMPRLVGLVEGLNLILGARPINGIKAFKVRLADSVVAWEFFNPKVDEFIQQVLTKEGAKKIKDRREKQSFSSFLGEGNPLGRAYIFHKAEKDVQEKTKGHYPAPFLALSVIKDTYGGPLKEGLEKEIQAIVHNLKAGLKISKNLIQLFFTSEALKKDPGTPTGKPFPILSAGVLGAGVMGSGIAYLFSSHDIPVRMKDINWDAIGKGYTAAWNIYKDQIKKRRLKQAAAMIKFLKIGGTTDYTGFQHADLVIEAAVENLDLKLKILPELEEKVSDKCIIATNTSSLRIADMAKALKHPERFIGMHFFNPVNKMPLVEIIPGEKTSPDTIATAVEFCKKIGKTPILVGDCAGFVVNRIFEMGANEILYMLEEGVPREKLAKAMLDYGMPMDPFQLLDEVGNDVNYKVTKSLEDAYGERAKQPEIVKKIYEAKLFGKKTGKGFYVYQGKNRTPNPEINQWISGKKLDLSEKEIMDRIIAVMVNEASRCLEEKIIEKPAYLDMALIMGTGFPPFRGGLLQVADERGAGSIVELLKSLQERYGIRFAPSQLLLAMQKDGSLFYKKQASSKNEPPVNSVKHGSSDKQNKEAAESLAR